MADLHRLDRREGRRRASELLERFDLVEAAGRMVAIYSGGMRRRLDLAMTLMGDPQIIFLDEPTTGLDPRSRQTMWQIIRQLAAAGVTIFLTTQNLDEADRLSERIAVLDHGRVIADAAFSPASLSGTAPSSPPRGAPALPPLAIYGPAPATTGGAKRAAGHHPTQGMGPGLDNPSSIFWTGLQFRNGGA